MSLVNLDNVLPSMWLPRSFPYNAIATSVGTSENLSVDGVNFFHPAYLLALCVSYVHATHSAKMREHDAATELRSLFPPARLSQPVIPAGYTSASCDLLTSAP